MDPDNQITILRVTREGIRRQYHQCFELWMLEDNFVGNSTELLGIMHTMLQTEDKLENMINTYKRAKANI